MSVRKLTRKAKDAVAMRQFGLCGYCTSVLTDSAQVDHMDENRCNDAWENLIASCCNCHGDKTQHYRKKRTTQLEAMLENGRRNKAAWKDEWANDAEEHWDRLPHWLQDRVTQWSVCVYAARQRQTRDGTVEPFEKYRYNPR